jgi:hypothetical protein
MAALLALAIATAMPITDILCISLFLKDPTANTGDRQGPAGKALGKNCRPGKGSSTQPA